MSKHSVLVTGAGGNLGGKLIATLGAATWCSRIIAVDRPAALEAAGFEPSHKIERRPINLVAASAQAHADAVTGADAIVHFAVTNPLPDATWEEAADSFAMTARLLMQARDLRVRRFVFASSNHAVGRLKEESDSLAPGSLGVDRVAPGTRWETLDGFMVGQAYGASKVFSERMCLAAAQPDGLSTLAIRIGWYQAGENHPETLNAGGNPQISERGAQSRSDKHALTWFRNMWLSNRDFAALFERAILAESVPWPQPGIVINGVSANSGMPWEIESARRLIGYVPQDDVWTFLS